VDNHPQQKTASQPAGNGGKGAPPASPPPAGAPAAARKMPHGLINMSARYAQYDPGIDTRDIKRNLGKKGAILHGYLLGRLEMPSTIEDDETGEVKPWSTLCIELLEECPAKYPDPEDPQRIETRTAAIGERIVLTITSAVQSLYARGLENALADTENVYEVWIQPQAGKTQGNRSLWQ
jgi:hypothetical protein